MQVGGARGNAPGDRDRCMVAAGGGGSTLQHGRESEPGPLDHRAADWRELRSCGAAEKQQEPAAKVPPPELARWPQHLPWHQHLHRSSEAAAGSALTPALPRDSLQVNFESIPGAGQAAGSRVSQTPETTGRQDCVPSPREGGGGRETETETERGGSHRKGLCKVKEPHSGRSGHTLFTWATMKVRFIFPFGRCGN